MNRTVNSLQERGYLRRRTDPEDRRRAHIAITDEGAEVVRTTIAKRDAWLTSRMRQLSPAERESLAAAAVILERLATE